MGLCWAPRELPMLPSSWLGMSLYWCRASGLAEDGLEGRAGRGEPREDLGERGGIFMLLQGT